MRPCNVFATVLYLHLSFLRCDVKFLFLHILKDSSSTPFASSSPACTLGIRFYTATVGFPPTNWDRKMRDIMLPPFKVFNILGLNGAQTFGVPFRFFQRLQFSNFKPFEKHRGYPDLRLGSHMLAHDLC